MFENTTVRGKSKPAPFNRQGSRPGVLLRSHQVPIGKWHLKSLMLAMLILVVFLYYVHMTDELPGVTGVKPHKRELVVRPAKPYKSPASRRRHSKQHKDSKGIQPPGKSNANISLIANKQIVDFKNNKAKVIPVPQPKITTIRPASNNALQYKSKFKNWHKSKVLQNLPTFSQVGPVKTQHLNTFKDSNVKGDKKPLPYNSPEGARVGASAKTPLPANYKIHDSNGMIHESIKIPNVLRYSKNNNGSFNMLKPLLQAEVHGGANNKPAIPENNGRFHIVKSVEQAELHDDANKKPVIPANNGRFQNVKPVAQVELHNDANNKPVIPANNGRFQNVKPVAQVELHNDANNKPVIPANNGRFQNVKPLFQAEVHEGANNKPVSPDKNGAVRPAVIPKPVIKMRRNLFK